MSLSALFHCGARVRAALACFLMSRLGASPRMARLFRPRIAVSGVSPCWTICHDGKDDWISLLRAFRTNSKYCWLPSGSRQDTLELLN